MHIEHLQFEWKKIKQLKWVTYLSVVFSFLGRVDNVDFHDDGELEEPELTLVRVRSPKSKTCRFFEELKADQRVQRFLRAKRVFIFLHLALEFLTAVSDSSAVGGLSTIVFFFFFLALSLSFLFPYALVQVCNCATLLISRLNKNLFSFAIKYLYTYVTMKTKMVPWVRKKMIFC